jgi:DNA polymerase III delta subunit
MNTLMPLKPVYALIGEDSFLQLQKLSEIRAQLPKDVQSMEFDGERAELAEVLDELRSFAMFGGGGKLVIVRNADDFISRFRPQLEDYLAKPSSSGVLVLRVSTLPKTTRIYKMIDKLGGAEVCEAPKQAALPQWIIQRGKSVHKLAIEPAAANLLADLIGNDLGRLDNELAKIALQVDGGRVSTEQVLHSVSFQREQEIYDMTNELAMGRPDEALRRWRHLVQLDSSAEFRAVTWLTMWLEDVGAVVTGGSTAKMAWKYRERLPQFIKVANSLGKSRYARAVTLLAEMDRRAKSGLGDATDNVEQFILSFATEAKR